MLAVVVFKILKDNAVDVAKLFILFVFSLRCILIATTSIVLLLPPPLPPLPPEKLKQ
jgi:hypothetical protein